MKRALILLIFPFILLGTGCTKTVKHSKAATDLMNILNHDSNLKKLVEKSIYKAAIDNPNWTSNPVRSLDRLYDFIDYSITCMPWNITQDKRFDDFATKCDQSILYIYYLFDQPLEELKDKGLFYNSVEYLDPIVKWFVDYNNSWREFLDTEESWKEEYYQLIASDPGWNLDKGWYEDKSNWHTFNQFFARKLSSPSVRPISGPSDHSDIIAPADSLPQGQWTIDGSGKFETDPIKTEQGIVIKSSVWVSVEDMLGEPGKEYADHFKNGQITHTYLNYDDYHRYHVPVSGKVIACYNIPYANAVGGIVYWDKEHQKYFLESNTLSWQAVESRGVVIIDTTGYANCGYVAVMPIGMGQVSSVNFEDDIKVNATVTKGQPLGYFLFGGSDCVMLFENQAEFKLTVPESEEKTGYMAGYEHVLCGEQYGVFHGLN